MAAQEQLQSSTAPTYSTLQPPYEGSKVMIKIGNTWITSKYDEYIHKAKRGPILRSYCKDRHDWDDDTMDLINWQLIDRVRRNQKWADLVAKPRMRHSFTYQCIHRLMKKARTDAIDQIHESRKRKSVNRQFMDVFTRSITCGFTNSQIEVPQYPKELATAVCDQNKIGSGKMLQGYL
eukprot:scaffold187764_cov48-Cyclotella_meneghiniana.AAC.1